MKKTLTVVAVAVSLALTSAFDARWPISRGFLRSLPQHERLNFETETRKLQTRIGAGGMSTGDVVAAQTYWFWVFLLTSRFHDRLWRKHFAIAFPYAPRSVDRAVVHARCESVRLADGGPRRRCRRPAAAPPTRGTSTGLARSGLARRGVRRPPGPATQALCVAGRNRAPRAGRAST